MNSGMRGEPRRPAATAGSEAGGAPPDCLARLEGATVRHGDTIAVDRVDLTVNRGEIVSLIGPNGSGKTSMVRALLGLAPLDAGAAWRKPGIRVGYVPLKVSIDRSMPLTVGRFLSIRQRRSAAEIEAALAQVGVAHIVGRPVQNVSGGEFQRMLLARALLKDPDLLVLDEPAQGVDVAGQEELYRLIERIRDERDCGVLIISHDLHLVMASTDHVVCLNHHVCCEGQPSTVAAHPAYLELFGEHAGRALALYTHRHDHMHDHGHDHGHIHTHQGDRDPPARQ